MKTAKYLCITFFTLTLATTASAQSISYNYAEARFLDSEIGIVDGDGV